MAYLYSGEFEKGEKMILKFWSANPVIKTLVRDIADAFTAAANNNKALEYLQKTAGGRRKKTRQGFIPGVVSVL